MKKLLVTGASGLLGLNLVFQASDRYEMLGVMRHERVSDAYVPNFQPIYADLCEPGQVECLLDQAAPDAVIHCAALTDVDYCETHPEEAELVNTQLPGLLARETARRKIQLLYISTDSVFDGENGGYVETDEPHPVNIYAQTKLGGERIVAEENTDALIARVNFYGWSWQGQRSLAEWFYNNLSEGRAIQGFTDIVFCPLLANQMAEILLRMLEMRLSGLYHVVSSECQSKFAFGKMLARQFGFDEQRITPGFYQAARLRAPRSRILTLSSEKLARALGEPLPDQSTAMRRFYELYCQGLPQTLHSMIVPLNTTK